MGQPNTFWPNQNWPNQSSSTSAGPIVALSVQVDKSSSKGILVQKTIGGILIRVDKSLVSSTLVQIKTPQILQVIESDNFSLRT